MDTSQTLLPTSTQVKLPAGPDAAIAQGEPKDWYKKIAIVRSEVKRELFPTEDAFIAENECIRRSEIVQQEVEKLGIPCTILVADSELTHNLIEHKPDLCINFADTVRGETTLCSSIPGVFDLLNIQYLGTGTLGLAVNCNKYLTKTLLEAWEIPTPQYQLLRSPNQELDYDLRFPLMVKLNEEHGNVGISNHSVVTNDKELKTQVQELISTYHQPVLVEEFIDGGRELSGYVLESRQMNTYLSEKSFTSTDPFKLVTFERKWAEEIGQADPITMLPFADLDGKLTARIKEDVRLAFEILKMDDYARFDIILDKYNNHYLIDCNSNPYFAPDDLWAETLAHNSTFGKVLTRMFERNMLDKQGISLKKRTRY